jgi:glycosyltransferase WbpL
MVGGGLMGAELAVVAFVALLMAVLITGLTRRLALLHGVIDVPNARSSHRAPTPRGGGVSIAIATTVALLLLSRLGTIRSDLLLALAGGGLAVAIVGIVDDRKRVPPGVRFAVHLAAAAWALACLGGLGPLLVGNQLISFGWSGYVLGVLGIVWVLNLFNFMDGIDGIAASEAVFVAWSGALLAATTAGGAAAVILGAASLGFLCWNWPPARIFMGDVGSGYTGYAIGVLALAAARDNPVALWVWLILGGVFFVDATITLIRRLVRRNRVYEAHRSHAYQWLARRWGTHRRVTVAMLLVDVFWLLPCAVFATLHPSLAALTTLLALTPVAALAVLAGSGRPEQPERATS